MFSTPDPQQYTEIIGTYSTSIILLSVLIIAFTSYTTLSLYRRMQEASFFRREVWLVLAALALGFGIWATHFVSMNSLHLPLDMKVRYGMSLLSMVPGIIAALLAFQLVQGPMKSCWRHAIGAALIAEGITAMHLIGMEAVEMDALMRYDWKLLVAANIAGGVLAYGALRIVSTPARRKGKEWLAVLFLGLAPLPMHVLGLFGTHYYVEAGQALIEHPVSHMHLLNALIGIGVGVLLVGLLLTTYIDGYVDNWLKFYDVLTKLPNRRNWERTLTNEIAAGDVAVWNFPDLQRVNQIYGYETGDRILQEIGQLLAKWKPSFAKLYRVSGNRYLFCVTQAGRSADFYKSLVVMQREVDQLIPVKRQEMRYVCGLAKADRRKTKKQLYKEALLVVEQAATEREYGLLTFNPDIHGLSYEQEVLRDIGRAMEENQLHLVYQPKVKGKSDEFTGAEALLRWEHPEFGSLPPAMFVPILEADGRMGEVTDWIIDQVCRQIIRWERAGIHVPQVAINIPGGYISEPHLLDVLWKTTGDFDLDPGRIELEITETSTAKSVTEAIGALKRFKRYGFAVALDDFGTGVSSLSYLQQLPITTLKIDKSFTDVVPAPPKECAVLNAILAIGESMGLDIVIEGVETKEQVDFLLKRQPELIFQGYYFAKPLPPDELAGWLKETGRLKEPAQSGNFHWK